MEDSSSDGSASEDPLDLTQDEGWQDVEPDVEPLTFVSLLDDKTFSDARSMLEHCKALYGFDFVWLRKELDLDYLGTIKLVNYIRSEVTAGRFNPAISSAALEDDQYLIPVLEDDAILYSLDDLDNDTASSEQGAEEAFPAMRKTVRELKERGQGASSSEIQLLAKRLRAMEEQRLEENERLHSKLAAYEEEVQKWGRIGLEDVSEGHQGNSVHREGVPDPVPKETGREYEESSYFDSYSKNDIHEIMLKDKIRTEAYRDFIYDNKHLFKNKVVLDVGCGTGILSMFCAKAGAKLVMAVDNSKIIDKAREIIYENGLDGVIKCIHGKIEEVTLPVKQVDIVVSEWMGYCLLFEAMLDSVIWARDHYLSPGGLLIPSHTTLRIAPYVDPDYIEDRITPWSDVYGFNMSAMLKPTSEATQIRTVPEATMAADSYPFLPLNLYTATPSDLEFVEDFNLSLKQDIVSLDGFALWFDVFFMPSRDSIVPPEATPQELSKDGTIAFTTGPSGPYTHWEQGVLFIDRRRNQSRKTERGCVIKGSIQYKKPDPKSRFLEVIVKWDSGEGENNQRWVVE